MDGTNFDNINYDDQVHKCRICFKPFGINEHQITISKIISRKFRDLTQTEVNIETHSCYLRYSWLYSQLKISENYSRIICVLCNFQLKNFCVFKKNVIQLQKGLYKITNLPKAKNEEWPDDTIIKEEEFQEEHLQDFVKTEHCFLNNPESEFLDCGEESFGKFNEFS